MNKGKQKLAAGEVVTMFNPDYAAPRLDKYVAAFAIDVINIGVNDVAVAAGCTGEPEHPKVVALVEDAIARILKSGKTVGLNVLTNWEERMPYFLGKGVRWFNVHVNTFIMRGARQYTELLARSRDCA